MQGTTGDPLDLAIERLRATLAAKIAPGDNVDTERLIPPTKPTDERARRGPEGSRLSDDPVLEKSALPSAPKDPEVAAATEMPGIFERGASADPTNILSSNAVENGSEDPQFGDSTSKQNVQKVDEQTESAALPQSSASERMNERGGKRADPSHHQELVPAPTGFLAGVRQSLRRLLRMG